MTPRRPSLTHWILLAMVAGVVLGWASPGTALALEPLSTVFLRLIKSLIVPLVASTLIVGIAGHGDDMRRVGRLALRSVVYFEVVTTLALVVGLVVVNIAQPGVGVHLPGSADASTALAGGMTTFGGIVEHTVPQSVFEAAASNNALQIVVWAGLFGVALTRVRAPAKERMLSITESVAEVTFRMVDLIMWFAPFGIGAALAATIARHGLGVLGSLGALVLTLYAALVVFCVAVLVPVAVLTGVPLKAFLRAVREPALIAFSTSTSEAALPRAMEAMEALGVPRRIVAFVIPVGYSFNLDGSTLYLAVTAMFAAEAGGITLTVGRQIVLLLTLMLTSKGVAGVPRASLVILSGAIVAFGLPAQAVALILGVDAFMDMARTTVNVVGNCLASVVVARWEGELKSPPAAAALP
ncbi:MAG TPA: dicarboxylate/amino acid:cation symporter [Gemmatimonadaceae bacterium]|nr:dicarboxylate/amino acid:cation symporter [Gemmatimonadaceae bacterium]